MSLALHRASPGGLCFPAVKCVIGTMKARSEVEVRRLLLGGAPRGGAEVGGFGRAIFFYAEDVDWCKRFWDSGWKVVFMPEATATHFGGASSANAPSSIQH